ncbi:Histocompatibility antigen 60b [Apodemus speciosus]|uniref:Histocompatibility antigen 60b n=1 Tax=Apodemus speciosus TaxID=105296 RepID=A0ABQ0F6U7_APOSI
MKVWVTRGHKCAEKQGPEEGERDWGFQRVTDRQRSLLENGSGTDSLSCQICYQTWRALAERIILSEWKDFFFQFNNKNQATPFSNLTVEEHATEVYADLLQSVENILEVMRNQLRNTEPEQFKTMGKHTLQVAMKTQYNEGQLTDAFCNFTIGGQSSFSFHPIKNTWRGSGPDASSIMKQWEGNRELGQGLEKLLKGDFTRCYKKFLTLWRETPSKINNKGLGCHPDYICHPDCTHSKQHPSYIWRPESKHDLGGDSMYGRINPHHIDHLGVFVVAMMVNRKGEVSREPTTFSYCHTEYKVEIQNCDEECQCSTCFNIYDQK